MDRASSEEYVDSLDDDFESSDESRPPLDPSPRPPPDPSPKGFIFEEEFLGSGFRSIGGQSALKYGEIFPVDNATAPPPQSFMSTPFCLAISPDGKKLAVGYKGGLGMFSRPKMKKIGRTVTTTTIDRNECSPDCQKIAVQQHTRSGQHDDEGDQY